MKDINAASAAAAELNSLLDKALPEESLGDGMEFHIVWNPGHPRNPRFAFADLEQAQQLHHILSGHLDGRFFIMSHYPKRIL